MTIAGIAVLLKDAWERLAAFSETPRLEAEVLLAHTLNKPRGYLHTWPERTLDTACARHFAELIERRAGGEPLAYLLGRREFWSLDLVVTPATLIPRPETELLVELALERIPADRPVRVADLGTGSGAIALAIASERPAARIVATDASAAALDIAEHNAHRLAIGNVEFRQGDWHAPLGKEKFGIIVSNPPYLADDDPYLKQGDLPFEPFSALAAGHDGLDAIRVIIAGSLNHLEPGGWLLLEHGYDQGDHIPKLLDTGGFEAITDREDAAGLSRVSCGRRPHP